MSKFNPDFWEVTISEDVWQQFTLSDALCYESADEIEARHAQAEQAVALRETIEAIVDEVLTPRQREVVDLYFFKGYNQRQIGEKLNISQQSVSEHLYGQIRNGRSIGGALRKLRKVCLLRGIDWQ